MEYQLSPLAAAADQQLRENGTNLVAWLFQRRAEGLGLRAMAAALTDQLGWESRPISHQTVANWLAEYVTREPAA